MELASSGSLFFFPSPPRPCRSRTHSPKKPTKNPKFSIVLSSIASQDSGEESSTKRTCARFLQLSVTLTIFYSSLPQPHAQAKVAEKKPKSKAKRPADTLSADELKSWSRGLPTVSDRIPYTEVLNLKEEGKLKHIVKLPAASLRQRPDPVLVVLDDSRVLRTALPTAERDERFWESWDRLGLDSYCMNAYTPPIKKPEVPAPYLGWLAKLPEYLFSVVKPKPKSKRVLELERARKELAERRRAELTKVRWEREAMEKALRAQKKADERKRKLEMRKVNYVQSLRQARKNYRRMADVWASMARDKNVATAIGFVIFFIFYRTVVLNYRKQQKDYEDRLKIEKAEAEERKKMRQLEREMMGLEGPGDDEGKEGSREQNPYMKMAMQFMQSGARVRRANRKLPQYLERGVDVKFSDVAGLGNIKLELEEIVKFFTLGEMYRRRGVKIPGQHYFHSVRVFYTNLLCSFFFK